MSESDDSRKVQVPAPRFRISLIAEIRIHQITEDELNRLEEGSPATLFLNFSLWFLSSGLSFLAALLATSIDSLRVFTVFVVVCVASFIAGAVLFVLWWRSRKGQKLLIEAIRNRMPPVPGKREGEVFILDESE